MPCTYSPDGWGRTLTAKAATAAAVWSGPVGPVQQEHPQSWVSAAAAAAGRSTPAAVPATATAAAAVPATGFELPAAAGSKLSAAAGYAAAAAAATWRDWLAGQPAEAGNAV